MEVFAETLHAIVKAVPRIKDENNEPTITNINANVLRDVLFLQAVLQKD